MSSRVLQSFYFMAPPGCFGSFDEEVGRHQKEVAVAADIFRSNIEAATTVASIPFLMANQAAHAQRFHSLLTAESIRALTHVRGPGESAPPEAQRRAVDIAKSNFAAELESEKGVEHLRDDTVGRLKQALADESFRDAASQLLSETIVMLWGAFEAFVHEVVRNVLNVRPVLALQLVLRDPAKKHFPKTISIEALAERGFDVQNSLGDLLLSDIRLDSLTRIRDIFSALAPSSHQVHSKQAARELWILFQRRHLIVHKRGRVDVAYLAQTGDALKLGDRLKIGRDEIDAAVVLLVSTSIDIMSLARLSAADEGV